MRGVVLSAYANLEGETMMLKKKKGRDACQPLVTATSMGGVKTPNPLPLCPVNPAIIKHLLGPLPSILLARAGDDR